MVDGKRILEQLAEKREDNEINEAVRYCSLKTIVTVLGLRYYLRVSFVGNLVMLVS